MSGRALIIVCILISVVIVNQGQAYTVHLDELPENQWTATGISNLTIGSEVYNVDFIWGYYNYTFGDGEPAQFTNPIAAAAARNAINNALNGWDPFPTNIFAHNWEYTSYSNFAYYLMPYGTPAGTAPYQTIRSYYSYSNGSSWGYLYNTNTNVGPWAYFTIVPIPGAVWLLGSGLIGIVVIRRRMRK